MYTCVAALAALACCFSACAARTFSAFSRVSSSAFFLLAAACAHTCARCQHAILLVVSRTILKLKSCVPNRGNPLAEDRKHTC